MPCATQSRRLLTQPVCSNCLYRCSLASNQLAGGVETGYVKKSKVQGESFEIGAKVMYEGRRMIVTQAPDSRGAIIMKSLPDVSGVLALAEAVKANKTLQSIK